MYETVSERATERESEREVKVQGLTAVSGLC